MRLWTKIWLNTEELLMFLFSLFLFQQIDLSWWWYVGLFFVPDISFLAYVINPLIGAYAYNILHHKGIMLAFYIIGLTTGSIWFTAVGIIFFGHSCFDRIMGYGLKMPESFQETHLGRIGK